MLQKLRMLKLLFLCYLFDLAASKFEDCGRVNLELGSNLFAITSDNSEEATSPWIAAIGAFRNSEDGLEEKFVVTCSGTILSRTLVITAAHCLDEGNVILPEVVRVGVTRIDQTGAQDRRIKVVVQHPDRTNNWYYDVALLVLDKELTFNRRVASLCLPEKTYTHPGEGMSILVQGWGEDINGRSGSQVSEVSVSVRSSQECDHRYDSAGPSSIEEVRAFLPKLTNSVLICADAALDEQQGVCNGDSGGPAFYRKFVNGVYRFFLVGIVTGNPSSCFPKTLPDVYNFIGTEKTLDWIHSSASLNLDRGSTGTESVENPCSQSPCGANADCSANGARAVCRCRPNYEGDPFVQCNLNPCQQSPCGINADCSVTGQTRVCKCRPNYVGDPFSECRLDPCSTNPCGPNADCSASGSNAVCQCRPNYTGDPYTNCNILDPCSRVSCGQGASCENNGRGAVCRCPQNFIGDPNVRCRLDPCKVAACGPNAECSAGETEAVCTCFRGYVGRPYSRSGCRRDTPPSSSSDSCEGLLCDFFRVLTGPRCGSGCCRTQGKCCRLIGTGAGAGFDRRLVCPREPQGCTPC